MWYVALSHWVANVWLIDKLFFFLIGYWKMLWSDFAAIESKYLLDFVPNFISLVYVDFLVHHLRILLNFLEQYTDEQPESFARFWKTVSRKYGAFLFRRHTSFHIRQAVWETPWKVSTRSQKPSCRETGRCCIPLFQSVKHRIKLRSHSRTSKVKRKCCPLQIFQIM